LPRKIAKEISLAIFAALGFIVAVIVPKIKSVLPVSLSIVFSFYIIGIVAATLDLKELYYLSPFKYFDSMYILQHMQYEASYVIVAASFIVASVVAGYIVYSRKDIKAA
jgi:ABC-2 type transport system permease protein